MNKRVLLVNPPFYAFLEYERWWYAFSCVQLAGCLLNKGIETFVYDGDKYFKQDPLTKDRQVMMNRQSWYRDGVDNDEHYIWKHFNKTLEQLNPDIVGVSVWTCSLRSAMKILKLCKDFNPQIKTCVGGYHIFSLSDYFKDHPLINAVFVGPAEYSLPDWILDGCKEKFIKTDPRSIDIKQIPAPARESLLYPECFSPNDMGMVMTSRGCPFDCSFCSNRLLTGLKYQFRTVEHVREELEHIVKKYHVEYLNIADANFLADRNNALRMAELFKTFRIPWGCEGLISAISEEILKKLIHCGCDNISFGIESGSQSRLDKLNKKITLEQIEKTSTILNKYQIKWKAFFIVGFPDDTLEEMEQTRQFALKIKPNYISLNSFVPLPGTEIYNSWSHLFTLYDISEYNQLNPKANFMKNMNVCTYQERFKSILKDFDDYNKQANSVSKFQGK